MSRIKIHHSLGLAVVMQRHVSERPKQVFLVTRHARWRRRRRFHIVVASDVVLASPARFPAQSLERPILFSTTSPLLHRMCIVVHRPRFHLPEVHLVYSVR